LRDAGRRNDSRRLWFATLESKETNKRKGKPGGDFSKAGAADRESNVEHMQAAAVPTSEATGGDAGRGDGEKKEKEKEAGGWAGRKDWSLGRWIQNGWLERTGLRENAGRKTNAKKNGIRAS